MAIKPKAKRAGFVPKDMPYDTHNLLEVTQYFWDFKVEDLKPSDPDNWLFIPDFEMAPDGGPDFAGQLLGGAGNQAIASTAAHLLKAARVLLREHFSSIPDAKESAAEYWRTGAAINWSWMDKPVPSRAMRAAVYYFVIIDLIQDSVDRAVSSDASAYFMHAVTHFAAWSVDTESRALISMANVRSAAGRSAGEASGKARKQDNELRDTRIVAAAKRLGWPQDRRSVPKRVAQLFESISAPRVAQILRTALRAEAANKSSKST